MEFYLQQTDLNETGEVIGLQSLCKSFGNVSVLRDVSLSIGPGVTHG